MIAWLAIPENRILFSGILTLLAATLAACTAIWIATRVYREQKKFDAAAKVADEKRHAYQKFFVSAANVHTELRATLHRGLDERVFFENSEKRLHELFADQEALGLFANGETLKACRRYTRSLLALREHTAHRLFGTSITRYGMLIDGPAEAVHGVLDSREGALALARSEVLNQSISMAERDLEGLFRRMFSPEQLEEWISDFDSNRPKSASAEGESK